MATYRTTRETGKPLKQPFYIHPKTGDGSLALAGIYSWWKDPANGEEDPERWVGTYSIITTTATDDVGRVHDRMPMAVAQNKWDDWLDPALTDPAAAHDLMAPPCIWVPVIDLANIDKLARWPASGIPVALDARDAVCAQRQTRTGRLCPSSASTPSASRSAVTGQRDRGPRRYLALALSVCVRNT